MFSNLREELRLLTRMGFTVTASGQISQRSLDDTNIWYTTTLNNKEIATLNISGAVISATDRINFATKSLHSIIYRTRPDVNAIVHVHPDHTVAWSLLRKPFLFTTQESSLFYNDIAQVELAELITNDNADLIAQNFASVNTLIMNNHGAITLGANLESAIWRTILLDKICKLNLLALSAGLPHEIDTVTLEKNHKFFALPKTITYQYNSFKNNYGA